MYSERGRNILTQQRTLIGTFQLVSGATNQKRFSLNCQFRITIYWFWLSVKVSEAHGVSVLPPGSTTTFIKFSGDSIDVLDLQQFLYCNWEAISFAPFIREYFRHEPVSSTDTWNWFSRHSIFYGKVISSLYIGPFRLYQASQKK